MTNRYVSDFDAPPAGSADELTRLLGGKGANLAIMANELGLPVPPGFTISTEACLAYLGGDWPDGLDRELREHMASLEGRIGRTFAADDDPLLVSVRSGAPVSMPGMMDTVLDLGLTDASTSGLARATDDVRFAADCLRRFRDGYRAVIGEEEVAQDPWLQLRAAIEAVFRSWNSDRARAYRAREGIGDDLGTAVTVQAMVFGNRGSDSGTGVLFTRNPSTGEPEPYGDVMFDAQGEDVVAGTHEPKPLAVLDERLPEVAVELRRHADVLERHYRDLCDIEFTIEQGRLWLLQVRVGKRSPGAALRMAADMANDAEFPLTREEAVRRVAPQLADPPRVFVDAGERPEPIASGLPASPGVATGTVALTADAAEAAGAAGRSVILVRSETSPEDVRGMAAAAGVLTARGGLASHAAVVARGWGIPAVVGAGTVHPHDDHVEIGGRRLEGEEISVDGASGDVFLGALAGSWEVAPEAATLRAWAEELGIEVIEAGLTESNRTGDHATGGDAGEPPLDDDVIRALLVKGATARPALAEAMRADAALLEPLLEGLTGGASVEMADGVARLSPDGKLRALELYGRDRDAVGEETAARALDAFHGLDGRMKEIVTAWQVRDVNGEQALNDHADAAYDAAVLDDLATLHAETVEWMTPLCDAFRRFGVYRARLGDAAEAARGDQRFVASPRVDSYHSVWFELHEDLIRLAGRRRADEAAAGRA